MAATKGWRYHTTVTGRSAVVTDIRIAGSWEAKSCSLRRLMRQDAGLSRVAISEDLFVDIVALSVVVDRLTWSLGGRRQAW